MTTETDLGRETRAEVAQVLDAEDQRAKACTCGASHRQFQIPTSCDAAPYESMSMARIDRMRAEDDFISARMP